MVLRCLQENNQSSRRIHKCSEKTKRFSAIILLIKHYWMSITCTKNGRDFFNKTTRVWVSRPCCETQQTFVLMKTFFVFIFRRRLDQDEYIHLRHTSSEDVLVKTNIFVLALRLKDVLQKRLQNIFKTSCKDIFKMFSRHIIKLNCS